MRGANEAIKLLHRLRKFTATVPRGKKYHTGVQ